MHHGIDHMVKGGGPVWVGVDSTTHPTPWTTPPIPPPGQHLSPPLDRTTTTLDNTPPPKHASYWNVFLLHYAGRLTDRQTHMNENITYPHTRVVTRSRPIVLRVTSTSLFYNQSHKQLFVLPITRSLLFY